MLDIDAEWKVGWRNLRPSNGVRLHLGNDLWYKAARFPAIAIQCFFVGWSSAERLFKRNAEICVAKQQALKTHMHRHMVPGAAGSV